MEQVPPWKDFCLQALPDDQRLLILLAGYVTVPVLLTAAFLGAATLLYGLLGTVQVLWSLLRGRPRRVSAVSVGTRSPMPPVELTPGIPATERLLVPTPCTETGTNPGSATDPGMEFGILAHFRPGPTTPPATPRSRGMRTRANTQRTHSTPHMKQ